MPGCLDLGSHDLLRPGDRLYRWVHPQDIAEGRILPAHCPTRQWRAGLSCDWSVLAAPEETARRKGGSLPAHVLSISIRECVELGLQVRHCPVVEADSPDYNLAHCLVFPRESGKAAIRDVRDRFLARAKLVQVVPGSALWFRSLFRAFAWRRRAAALRYVEAAVGGGRRVGG